MNNGREQVWVGVFVLAAAGVLVAVVTAVSGAFSTRGVEYRTYVQVCRRTGAGCAGPVWRPPLAGKVMKVRVPDPQDSTRIEIGFRVAGDFPVKADSLAKIHVLGRTG